jgi:hypothetical protein
MLRRKRMRCPWTTKPALAPARLPRAPTAAKTAPIFTFTFPLLQWINAFDICIEPDRQGGGADDQVV